MAGGQEGRAATVKMCLACNHEFEGNLSHCPTDGTSLILIKQEDEFIGKVLADRYYITDIIGKGGMGVVYLARHQMMDRMVAIKMLQTELTQDENSVRRFQQEAKAASCLNHPHIITLHDFGIMPTGQPFIVMEYLEGIPLMDIVKRQGPIDPPRAVKIFSEVADGLYHAHNQGILHRDLKPSNIILTENDGNRDFVKVVDFGLAKLMPWSGKESQHLTKTGEVFGSPIYMSPEQCMGKQLKESSDVYSLGITLFEALTGKPPFRGSNSIKTASMHMTDSPPRFAEVRPDLQLPEGLEKVVMIALAKDPQERFQNMADFKDALLSGLTGDLKIDMPSSLMVSRHHSAISAVSATVKTASKKERSVTDLRAKTSKTHINPAIIGGGVAAIAAIGAAAFFLLQPTPVDGEIYYFNGQSGQMHIHDDKVNTIKKLKVTPDTVADSNWHIGLRVKAAVHGDTLQSVSSSGPDRNLTEVLAYLNDFLWRIGDLDVKQAVKMTPYSEEKLREMFAGLVRPDSHHSWPDVAFKIQSVTDADQLTTKVAADMRLLYQYPTVKPTNPFLLFSIQRDKKNKDKDKDKDQNDNIRIQSISTITEEDWNKL